MKNWNQLFARHGWLLKEGKENIFTCTLETKMNIEFLTECLDQANVEYFYDGKTLEVEGTPVSEQEWLEILDFKNRGMGGYLWFAPGKEEPKVRELDTFICGIIRQLNRLGIFTDGSCVGHGKRLAYVRVVKNEKDIHQLMQIFAAIGLNRVQLREQSQGYHISFPYKREQLLEAVEKLSSIKDEWMVQGPEFAKEQLFYHLLEKLLSIPGESGNEGMIRDYVKEKLTPFVDYISVDRNGNLLAEKTYKAGSGPTVLLNAHLDVVEEFAPNRILIKENEIWSSNKGILGADDRAGVAVLLHVAEQLKDSSFSGKVKFIFTVKEEAGLVGARKVDDYFLWGTDAAIVVDRRGKGDIVTSCGGYIPFCDDAYGSFFEKIAKEDGLTGWKCTAGGSSDTRIWAEHGIQSVNLSAGYQHEHTVDEYLDVNACYQTAKLIQGFFEKGRELRGVLRELRRERVS